MAMALSRADWAAAALGVIADDGLAAVAVEPLAARLGATKGSFYWHFRNRAELIDAALELWEWRTEAAIAELELLPTPAERLIALAESAYTGAVEGDPATALMAVAGDERVAAVVRRVTARRLAVVESLYLGVGLAPEAARRAGRVAYATYLGLGALRRVADDGAGPVEARAYVDEVIRPVIERGRARTS
jgi:AcrR family transcriptional regulator